MKKTSNAQRSTPNAEVGLRVGGISLPFVIERLEVYSANCGAASTQVCGDERTALLVDAAVFKFAAKTFRNSQSIALSRVRRSN